MLRSKWGMSALYVIVSIYCKSGTLIQVVFISGFYRPNSSGESCCLFSLPIDFCSNVGTDLI